MSTKMIVLILCCGIVSGYAMFHKSASPAQSAMEVASTEAAAHPAAAPSAVSVNTPPDLAANATPPDPATQPKLSEVRTAVTRMFGKVVTVDERRQPDFVVGDFNGDHRQDLAVVVQPVADKLAEINSETANWTIQDPFKVQLVDPTNLQRRSARPVLVYVEKSDLLLAIIHGYGADGWRSRETTQAFLLKRAVGTDMRSLSRQDLLKATKNVDRLPALVFDVVSEVIDKQSGFLLWTGAKYAWYKMPAAAGELAENNPQ
jgi:hypothetical protein